MASTGQVDFFSADPALNPLLDAGLRPELFAGGVAALAVALVAGLVYASFCDLWRGRLTPNWFTHGLIGFSALAAPILYSDWVAHLVIGAVMALLFGLLWQIGGIGMGDVKLFVGLGLALGLAGIAVVALAQIVAVLVGLPIALATRRGRKMAMPMFPAAAVALLVVLAGLGAEGSLILAGTMALAAACLYGLIERRLRPAPSLEALAEPVLSGQAGAVRLRPYERPLLAGAGGGFDPEAGEDAGRPRVRRRDLEVLSHSLLSTEQVAVLDRVGEVATVVEVAGQRLSARFIEGLAGYTLDLSRSSA